MLVLYQSFSDTLVSSLRFITFFVFTSSPRFGLLAALTKEQPKSGDAMWQGSDPGCFYI